MKFFDDDIHLLHHVSGAHNGSEFFKPFKKLIRYVNVGLEMGIVKT